MILLDILDEINMRSGADIEEGMAIRLINSAVRTYGRYIGRGSMESIKGVKGVGIYPIPPGINSESIRSVIVDGVEYKPLRYDELADNESWSIDPAGFIHISGGGEEITILHDSCCQAKGRDSCEDFDEQDLNVDDEYINAVIYGALAEYGEVAEDIEMANNYRSKALDVVARAMQGRYQKRGKYPVTKDVM